MMKDKAQNLIALLALLCGITCGVSAETKPNIVLIISDDLGVQLGCYGDANAVTPSLDKFASEGVLFSRGHVTAASCSPSRGSIFTGLYPHQHGMYGLSQFGSHVMHDDVPKLPNALKDLGYQTAIIGKTHFEPFDDFEWDLVVLEPQRVVRNRDVRYMNERAREFIEQNAGRPFFLVMSYVDPHRITGEGTYGRGRNIVFPRVKEGLPESPLSPEEVIPMPFFGVDSPEVRLENSDYYAAVERMDVGVGEFMELLGEMGLDGSDTLLAFIGDHGPDVTRGKISVYKPATHIPFILRWPGHLPVGEVRDHRVSTIDLFPTFLDAAGAKQVNPDKRMQGLSLLPVARKGDTPWRFALFTQFINHVPWYHFYPRYTVFQGRYHLIHNIEGGQRPNPLRPTSFCNAWWEAQDDRYDNTHVRLVYHRVVHPPEFELYDVESDPHEFHNLAEYPLFKEKVEALAKRIQAWREASGDPFLDDDYYQDYARRIADSRPRR